jgi:hypothetical protein
MLAVLDQHCRPDTISTAFSTLMSLFNDVQGPSEPILDFLSRFDGMVLDMSRSKILLPPIFLVMLFLCALHSQYSDILDQFRSRYKTLETATIDSVVADYCSPTYGMRIHEACRSGLTYPITRNSITLLLEPQVDTRRYGTLLMPPTMTRVSVQRHTTQNVRHTLHMMDTLRAHVLAVAHNLATYLCYNVCFPSTYVYYVITEISHLATKTPPDLPHPATMTP